LLLTPRLASGASCDPAPSGLLAWWAGEGNARDSFGTNDGLLVGSVSFTNGEVARAFSFDGATGYVNNAVPVLTGVVDTYTMEFWAWPTGARASTPEDTTDISGTSNQRYAIFPNNGGNGPVAGSGVSVGNNGSSVFEHASGYLPSLLVYNAAISGWTHIAVVYSNRQPTLYVNGVVVATGLTSARSSSPSACLGETHSGYGYYRGLLDEVSIYNRALSATEIQTIYDVGSAGKCETGGIATAIAEIVIGSLAGATVTFGGHGYTSPPAVKIIGGGSSGAQAVAVVSNGLVIAVNILNGGTGYTSPPSIVIDPPVTPQPVLGMVPASLLTFSNLTISNVYLLQEFTAWYWSNQAASFLASNSVFAQPVPGWPVNGQYRLALSPVPAQAFATPVLSNGLFIAATVTSGGSGYVTTPAVAVVGGGGANAAAFARVSGGAVTNIVVTDDGFGYTGVPAVQIAPPPATAIVPAVMAMMRVERCCRAGRDLSHSSCPHTGTVARRKA
jgi:hypothetical protein